MNKKLKEVRGKSHVNIPLEKNISSHRNSNYEDPQGKSTPGCLENSKEASEVGEG